MFFGISVVVMIFFCILSTFSTLQCSWMWHSSRFYFMLNCASSFGLFWIFNSMNSRAFTCGFFPFFRGTISLMNYFTSFAFPVQFIIYFLSVCSFSVFSRMFFSALFTPTKITIFIFWGWIKFRCFFNFLATATLFCFNAFRHGFFLAKSYCLEPFRATNLSGLLYYIPQIFIVKGDF